MIYINARFLTQPVTGVQRFAIEMCKELVKNNLQIQLIAPNNIISKVLAKELGVKIIGSRTGHMWEKIDLPLYLLTQKSPLLINLCNTSPLFYKNQFVTIHDMAVFENPHWFSKKFSLFYKLMYPLMIFGSKKVLTVSNFSKQEILKYLNIDPSKVEVIYNSVDHFKINEKEIKLNIYGKYLLCVGSVEPRKNLLSVIKAFQVLNLSDYKLVIVGGKNKLFNVLQLSEIISNEFHDKIIFTGYVSDEELSTLYINAVVFIYPSLYEGFGIPPLEAMKHGCVTMVSNSSSLPEICGNASFYINPTNNEEIVEKLKFLVENEGLKTTLINQGYSQVLKYSWRKSAQNLLSIIENTK